MNLLEDWLKKLIKKPITVLNDKYPDEDIVRTELDSLLLPLVDPYAMEQKNVRAASHVSDAVLQHLHKKIRNHPCEDAIWSGVFWCLVNPLPLSMAQDLVDRRISTVMMGMTRQVDEIQWRLATFDEEALYTLIRERYIEPQFSVAQFETMLRQYAYTIYSDGILYMLSFYETPSPKKKAAFIAAIVREKRNWRKVKYTKKRLKQFMREQSQ